MRWLVLLCLLPSFGLFAQTITIGAGTTATNNAPITANYAYSYSQSIYLASEIGTTGQITKLRYYVTTSPTTAASANNWTIYIGTTALNAFAGSANTDFQSVSGMTQVFSGIVTFPAANNWMEITLTTPFTYTGGNLLIAVDENSTGYTPATFRGTTSTPIMSVYVADDDAVDNPDPTNLTGTYSQRGSTARPNIQMVVLQPCTGMPSAGTVTTSPTTVSPGSTFSVSATGYTEAIGMTYQWQSNINNAGWSNVGTATASYTALTGQTGPALGTNVQYRLVVTCTATSDVAYSSVVNFTTDYCVPTATGTNYLNSIKTTGAVTNLNYSASSFTSYVNSAAAFSAQAGSSLNLTITPQANNTGYFYGWIDWNQNGAFETTEAIFTSGSAYFYNGAINIPLSTAAGNYRVRFANSSSTGLLACGNVTSGNFVDFMLNVQAAPSCNGAPVAGSATASPNSGNPGSTYGVSATGFSSATGLTFQWQSRTNNGTWNNVGTSTTSYAALTGLTASTTGTVVDYRLIVKCLATNDSTFSSLATFTSSTITYCTPLAGGSTYYLSQITTSNGLSNFNYTASSFSAYVNNTASLVALQAAGASITVNLTPSAGTNYFYCWVDWNNDGDFLDAGETIFATTTYTSTYTGTINIPSGTPVGSYRVRFANSQLGIVATACNTTGSGAGNFVDATISVGSLAPCSNTLSAGTVAVTPFETAPGGSYTVSATGYTTLVSGLSFQWQKSDNGGAWTNLGGATGAYATPAAQTAPALGNVVDYRLRLVCTSSNDTVYSTIGTFTPGVCGPTASGTVYLNGIQTTGGLLNVNYSASTNTPYVNNAGTPSFSQYAGGALNLNLTQTSTGSAGYFTVWVDWSQNSSFTDIGDTIIRTTTAAYYYNGVINIPASTTPGYYRIRFANSTSATAVNPCGPLTTGTYVDYTFEVLPAPACSGMPVGGTVTLVPTSAQPGATYNVSATGYTNATGMTFQWESNTNGAGWVSASAATSNYASLLNQIAPALGNSIEYRLLVACTAGPDTAYSNVVQFNAAHCIPTAGTTSSVYYLNSISSSNGLTNISYNASSYTAYVNNSSAPTVSQYPGSSVTLNLTQSSGTGYFYVWVDWNNDGDFTDLNEAVIATTTASAYSTNVLNVHPGQTPGNYRMRIATSNTSGVITSCGPAASGNYVDFTIEVLTPTACSGTPVGGTITVNPTAGILGSTYNVTVTGFTASTGLVYQWQTNTNNAGWVNYGSVLTAYAPLLNEVALAPGTVVDYRLIVICSAGPDSAYSTIGRFTSGYCTPTVSGSIYLNNITSTGGVTNLSYTGSSYTGYINNSGTPVFSQLPGSSLSLFLAPSSGTGTYACWIDWNNDGDFVDAGEQVFLTSSTTGFYNGLINVSPAQSAGNYRVRFGFSTSTAAMVPCGPLTTGQFIDFTLEVLPPPACTGTPVGGTVVVTPASGQPGSTYSVASSGFTIAQGLVFEWQSRTNSGAWVSASTPSPTYAGLTGLVSPALGTVVDYRLMVVCTSLNDTAYSAVGTFTSNYCTPTAGGTSTIYYIRTLTTTGSITTNLNYTATSYAAYVNQSASQVAQYPAASIPVSIAVSSGSARYYAWVDWNNDGIFGTTELVFSTTAATATYTGNIVVPGTQAAGLYRVRIGLNNPATVITACGPAASGSYVDFTLEVITAPACSAAPSAGTVSMTPAVGEVGSSFTVDATGFSTATGLSFQWQSSLNGAAWANVGTSTTAYASLTNQIAPAIGDTIRYRIILTCTAVSLSDTSSAGVFTSDYCKPSSSGTTYYINNFATTGGISNISNLASGYSTGGFGNYTSQTVSHVAGSVVNFTASFGASTSSTFGFAIWVDWNNNGVFETTERVFNSTSYNATYASNFTIPANASIGTHRMRVLADYNSTNPNTPCASMSSGEGEDYTLEVLATLNCSISPMPTAQATASVPAVCISDNVIFNLGTQLSAIAGLTYQWEKSLDAGTTWAPESGVTGITLDTFLVNATADYRLNILCNGTSWLHSGVVTVTANNPQVLSVVDSTRCGYGTVGLRATATTGATLNWYAAPTGGATIATGTTFTTPALSATTTYYVAASTSGGSALVGKTTPSATAGYLGTQTGLLFNATSNFVIQNATVYPVGSGTITVALTNNAGTVLASTPAISVSGNGSTPVLIPLNLSVTPGTGYRLILSAYSGITDLVRDLTGGPFPYNSTDGAMSITGGYISGSSAAYYYFYNMNISAGCESPRQPVVATVTTPVAIAATSASNTICKGSSTSVNATSSNPGYTYSWTPGNLAGASQTVSPTVTTQYIVWATDNTTGPNAGCVASDTIVVLVDSIATPHLVANPTTICSGETVSLTSTSNFVAGTGSLTSNTNDANPFRIDYGGRKSQYLITAAELSAMGLMAGASINSVAVEFTAVSTQVFNDLTVSAGFTTQTSLTTTFVTGMSSLYTTALFTPAVGVNSFSFSSPILWDGTSNVIVQFCWSNNIYATGLTSPTIKYNTTSPTITTSYNRADSQTAAVLCGTAVGNGTVPNRPMFILGASQASTITYAWSPGGMNTPNTTATPINNGTTVNTVPYTLTVTNTNNGCSSSATVNVDVKPAPIANIASLKTIICSDDTQGFYIDGSSSVNAGSYTWNPGAATTPSLLVTTPGTYYLEVGNSFNCTDTDTIVIIGITPVVPHIVIDHITSTEAILNAGSGYATYQWNTLEQTQLITVNSPGTYTVTVTDTNGCSAVAEPVTINKISVDEKGNALSFTIFPNPSNGILNVKFDNFMAKDMIIKLIDATGRTLQVQQLKDVSSSFTHTMDISSVAAGNYFIKVETNFGSEVKQIIVIK